MFYALNNYVNQESLLGKPTKYSYCQYEINIDRIEHSQVSSRSAVLILFIEDPPSKLWIIL